MLRNVFLLLCLAATSVQAQKEIELIDIHGHSDCKQAIVLNTSHIYGPTTAPTGFGNDLEFSNNPANSIYFVEKEHNTVWYKFRTIQNALLVFDLIPENDNDDYDFVLYKIEKGQGCLQIVNKEILPVRTNISRNDPEINSQTGLSFSITEKYEHSGEGKSYSSSIAVKKGDEYFLMVDNVYDGGSGHTIIFDYLNEKGVSRAPKTITDKVIDSESGKGVKAKIILQDKEGNIIAETLTDSLTGEYLLELPDNFDYKGNYSITVCSKGYFFRDKEINVKKKINTNNKEELKIQRLETGRSFSLSNIYFYENSPMYLPISIPVLDKLLKLLIQNESMTIEIEGHIHGCGADPESIQTLSEARALTVKTYLVRKGIDENRISTKGYGCSRMIYPKPVNEEERQMNRRVEIKILKY